MAVAVRREHRQARGVSDTIFALSSGRPPAAIAVLRISGPAARTAAEALAGRCPPPRRASLRTVRDAAGAPLDRALVLYFPGPATATGEDLVELHCHGGRAVVAAVEHALAALPGLRPARPGEFTRRALENGRIDLAQAQGLADLLEAETETQRRTALAAAEGAVGRAVAGWLDRLSAIAARVEAQLDFADEADVEDAGGYDPAPAISALLAEWHATLAAPSVERLRDGIRVVIAGPPNAGKSSLFNALADRDAAIVTPIAGTTRDILEAAVMRDGIPYRLTDTAGLAEATDDEVERIGIDRAAAAIASADMLLWMGAPAVAPRGAVILAGKADLPDTGSNDADLAVSARLPDTVAALWALLADRARMMLAIDGDMALRQSQRDALADAAAALDLAARTSDLLIVAEQLRVATRPLAGLLGRDATEAMLDALFGRFCLGK